MLWMVVVALINWETEVSYLNLGNSIYQRAIRFFFQIYYLIVVKDHKSDKSLTELKPRHQQGYAMFFPRESKTV